MLTVHFPILTLYMSTEVFLDMHFLTIFYNTCGQIFKTLKNVNITRTDVQYIGTEIVHTALIWVLQK